MVVDIEDLQVDGGPARPTRDGVNHRRRPQRLSPNDASSAAVAADEDVPGTAVVYLKTYGCSHNASDRCEARIAPQCASAGC